MIVSFQSDGLSDDSNGIVFVVSNEGHEAKDRGQEICEEEEEEEEEIVRAIRRRRREYSIPVLV